MDITILAPRMPVGTDRFVQLRFQIQA